MKRVVALISFRLRPVTAVVVLLAAAAGAVHGLIVGYDRSIPRLHQPYHSYPLPHCVSKYPDGVSLRFAMVHDVLHERYTRHGESYYKERNRRVVEALREIEGGQGSEKAFALYDDLGVGLDALQMDDEAVRVLREKLGRQEALGQQGRQLYTTYANLGTFLIHGNFRAAVSGDAAAKERLREGIQFITKSIEVNPEAHFGRESWQKHAAEFLEQAIDEPQILLERDLVGNPLNAEFHSGSQRSIEDVWSYSAFQRNRQAILFVEGRESEAHISRAEIRDFIKKVGKAQDIPFDEPALGIIGMWRLGGGANPHFALTLGEIMMRVGQRHIAWCAYERAAQLSGRFWPDREIQEKFIEHCRQRQAVIERDMPEEERDHMRPRFNAELAFGQRFQADYQKYEHERIAAGLSIDDEHFYDGFLGDHGLIASAVGDADWVVMEESSLVNSASVLLFAGIYAFAAGCLLRLLAWLTRRSFKRLEVPSPK